MKRLLSTAAFITYSAILVKVMVFKDMPTIHIGQLMLDFGGTNGGHPPNFIPFTTIAPYLFGEQGLIIAGVNLLGNIALLVPIGLLTPLVFRKASWKRALVIAITTGLAIEVLQAILDIGIFDIDDVLLNALGVMTGYWMFAIFAKWIESKDYKKIIVTVASLILVCAGSLYALYPKNQTVVNPTQRAASQNSDPCGTTKGTGEITNIGSSAITIRRNDDSTQKVGLTSRTTYKTFAGDASKDDLKTGHRVTVVVDDTETAAAVLVCGS